MLIMRVCVFIIILLFYYVSMFNSLSTNILYRFHCRVRGYGDAIYFLSD